MGNTVFGECNLICNHGNCKPWYCWEIVTWNTKLQLSAIKQKAFVFIPNCQINVGMWKDYGIFWNSWMLYCNVTKISWPGGNVHYIITYVSTASYPSLVSKSIKAYRFPFKNGCDSLLFLNVSLKCRIFVKITMFKQTFNTYLYIYIYTDISYQVNGDGSTQQPPTVDVDRMVSELDDPG